MATMRKLATAAAVLVSTVLLTAAERKADAPKDGPRKAVCVLSPTKGSDVHGVITFTQTDNGVEISGEVTGLKPGKHGFHVHEFGDLNSPDGMATGGHFDSAKHMHGAEDAADRHTGDLGNIEADGGGKAAIKRTDKVIALSGPNSIIGRGLIVHEKEDDLKTQPTGNAGGRIAQGVIGVAKP
jgi:Cu-Zn family superoxide dismutase